MMDVLESGDEEGSDVLIGPKDSMIGLVEQGSLMVCTPFKWAKQLMLQLSL